MMKCRNCQAEIADGSNFCPICGASLADLTVTGSRVFESNRRSVRFDTVYARFKFIPSQQNKLKVTVTGPEVWKRAVVFDESSDELVVTGRLDMPKPEVTVTEERPEKPQLKWWQKLWKAFTEPEIEERIFRALTIVVGLTLEDRLEIIVELPIEEANVNFGSEAKGEADFEKYDGSLIINNESSIDIEANDLGRLAASNHYNGSLTVGDIKSDLNLECNGSGDVSVGNIGGDVVIETTYNADFEIGKVDGNLKIISEGSGDFDVDDIYGNVTIASSSSARYDLGNIGGSLIIASEGSGNITTGDISGEVLKVETTSSAYLTVAGVRVHEIALTFDGSGDFEYDLLESKGPINISLSHNTNVSGGDITASSLTIFSDGSGDFDLGDIQVLETFGFETTYNSKLTASKLNAKAVSFECATGDVGIDEITADEASFSNTGSAYFTLGDGHLQNLHVTLEGSGDFGFEGDVENGWFETTYNGNISIPYCRNIKRLRRSGSGDINVECE